MSAHPNSQARKLKIAVVAPSLRYVGGQAVQADLLLRLWQDDPAIDITFIAVDPPLPVPLAWVSGRRFTRLMLIGAGLTSLLATLRPICFSSAGPCRSRSNRRRNFQDKI